MLWIDQFVILVFVLICEVRTSSTVAQPASKAPNVVKKALEGASRPGVWSEWSEWTSCSRSCNGGVSSRFRHCFPNSKEEKKVRKKNCRSGQDKQHVICNMQKCPDDSGKTFRSEQCARFNDIPYQGRYYLWEAAILPPNPEAKEKESKLNNLCALFCRPIGHPEIIVKKDDFVIDGTRCRNDSLDMCIQGTCMRIGCDLRIGSKKKIDSCGVCGGDGSSCGGGGGGGKAKGIFEWRETPLSHCSAPCGGGVMMARPMCVNVHSELEVSEGLCDSKSRPKGRMAPCNEDPCPSRWEVGDWNQCSRSCGGGFRQRSVSCVSDENGSKIKIDPRHCPNMRPPSKEACNVKDCPQWYTGLWSECSVTCGKGFQYRNVICRDHRGLPSGACNFVERPPVNQVCHRTCATSDTRKRSEETFSSSGSGTRGDASGWLRLEQDLDDNNITSSPLPSSSSTPILPPIPPTQTSLPVPSSPTFIVEEWGPCSAECGEGFRKRKVGCKIFLEFSKTIATLPDRECPGSKPAETEICYSGLCLKKKQKKNEEINNIQQDYVRRPNDLIERKTLKKSTYSWKDVGFTECSEPCLGGIQESKILCIENELGTPVAPNNCQFSERPEILVRTCNDHPCIPRWNVSEFSKCSKSCGGGIQIRTVSCIQEVRHGGNNILKIDDSNCPQPPPITQQFCNVIDCPVKWTTTSYTKCSATCGGGYKFRKVRCQQLLALGEMADKPEAQCPGRKPDEQKLCNPQHCPEVTGIYSQYHYDHHHQNSSKPKKHRRMPTIRANHNQNYVQKDPYQKSVKLKVGGKATIFSGTKVKVRCPVKKFDRSQIRWARDHKIVQHLQRNKKRQTNVFVTKKGGLRIKRITFKDSGIYTCMAKGSMATINLIVKSPPGNDILDSVLNPTTTTTTTAPMTTASMNIPRSNNINGWQVFSEAADTKDRWDPHRLWVDPIGTTAGIGYLDFESINDYSNNNNNKDYENNYLDSHYDYTSENYHKGAASYLTQSYDDQPANDGTEVSSRMKLDWRISEWSRCSQTCGKGGKKIREVECVLIEGKNVTAIPDDFCIDSGMLTEKPVESSECGEDTGCPKWIVEDWPECEINSTCIDSGKALQEREVICGAAAQDEKGLRIFEEKYCEAILKPKNSRTCEDLRCRGVWKPGKWSECKATCGQKGERLRKLQCVWAYDEDLETENESICDDVAPPSDKMLCFGSTCPEEDNCWDESKYCGLVRSFKMCKIKKYQSQCCASCSNNKN